MVFIANEFYPNIKPTISDDTGIVEGGRDSSYLIPGFRSIDFEGYTGLAVYLLAPFLSLYLILKDYFISVDQRQKFAFFRTFKKAAISSLIVAAVIGIVTSMTCSGEECLGILAAFIIALSGNIVALIITTIFYFISKNKFNSVI